MANLLRLTEELLSSAMRVGVHRYALGVYFGREDPRGARSGKHYARRRLSRSDTQRTYCISAWKMPTPGIVDGGPLTTGLSRGATLVQRAEGLAKPGEKEKRVRAGLDCADGGMSHCWRPCGCTRWRVCANGGEESLSVSRGRATLAAVELGEQAP
jgi:hypothetical protein